MSVEKVPSGETVVDEDELQKASREAMEAAIEEDGEDIDLAALSDDEFIGQIAACAQDPAFDADVLKRLFILANRYDTWLEAEALEDEGLLDDGIFETDEESDDDEALVQDPEPGDELDS